jgi:hypothetical protein
MDTECGSSLTKALVEIIQGQFGEAQCRGCPMGGLQGVVGDVLAETGLGWRELLAGYILLERTVQKDS